MAQDLNHGGTMTILFDNSYARLPERFFVRMAPVPVSAARLIKVNNELAETLGLDPGWLISPEGVEVLAGNRVAGNSEPIATAYAGHQFASFIPQLGDGRAILLGEMIDRSGVRRDIQLKGAGRTPFSRGGDGRAALGPVLREYVVSEAMAALGIRTTRALAAVATGEPVWRETQLPGAVLTRVASSHIRVGTFQFFASRGDRDAVRLLADHVIERHYPEAADTSRPYHALFSSVVQAQAELISRWLLVGFIHGVMNTDNMSIAGETIDYGPCAFMDEYHPGTVFSSIDRLGRYAYGNQPGIGAWNLARLAECLLPLFAEDAETALDDAREILGTYEPAFNQHYTAGLKRKVGLPVSPAAEGSDDADLALTQELLRIMAVNSADFTLTFRRLSEAAANPEADSRLESLFTDASELRVWLEQWRRRLEQEPTAPAERATAMRLVNPAVIPRNHRVEAVIRAAEDRDDFAPFEELLAVLSRPFEDRVEFAAYEQPPKPNERVQETFCGT
jgi:serine/tyrosine/threonine adenylyltransferase